MGWTITFEGKTYHEADLTLADEARALDISGGKWDDLHPHAGPGQFMGLLTAFLAAGGEDETAALVRVSQLHRADALAMIGLEPA